MQREGRTCLAQTELSRGGCGCFRPDTVRHSGECGNFWMWKKNTQQMCYRRVLASLTEEGQ
jgi:hypothetical protein